MTYDEKTKLIDRVIAARTGDPETAKMRVDNDFAKHELEEARSYCAGRWSHGFHLEYEEGYEDWGTMGCAFYNRINETRKEKTMRHMRRMLRKMPRWIRALVDRRQLAVDEHYEAIDELRAETYADAMMSGDEIRYGGIEP